MLWTAGGLYKTAQAPPHMHATMANRSGVSWFSCIGLFTSDIIQLMFSLSTFWLRIERDPNSELNSSIDLRTPDSQTSVEVFSPVPRPSNFSGSFTGEVQVASY